MKLIVYKGVSKKAVGIGIALYNKLKMAGREAKKTVKLGNSIITAKYTRTKKEVRILFRATSLCTGVGSVSPVVGALIDGDYVLLDGIKEYSPTEDEELDTTTAVLTAAIVDGLSINTYRMDATFPLIQYGTSPYTGSIFRDALQKGTHEELISTLMTQFANRPHELVALLGSPQINIRTPITEGNDLYDAGMTEVELEGPAFYGTDVDGRDVVVVKVRNPYEGTPLETEQVPLPVDINIIWPYPDPDYFLYTEVKTYYVALSLSEYLSGYSAGIWVDLDTPHDVYNILEHVSEPMYYFLDGLSYLYSHDIQTDTGNIGIGRTRQDVYSYIDRQERSDIYNASIAIHTATHDVWNFQQQDTGGTAQITTIRDRDSLQTTSSKSYRVALTDGVFSVVDTPPDHAHVLNATGSNDSYHVNNDDGSKSGSRSSLATAATSGEAIESYRYDGDPTPYESQYADGFNLSSSSSGTANPAGGFDDVETVSEFYQNRARMGWWHTPDEISNTAPFIAGRYLIKNADDSITPVHIHAGKYPVTGTQVYVNGTQVYSSTDGTTFVSNNNTSSVLENIRITAGDASYVYDSVTSNIYNTALIQDVSSTSSHSIVRYAPLAEDNINPWHINTNFNSYYLADIEYATSFTDPSVNESTTNQVTGGSYPFTYNYTQPIAGTPRWQLDTDVSKEGFRLMPLVWRTPTEMTVIQWARSGGEGMCIFNYDIPSSEYFDLLVEYHTDPDDDKLTVLFGHINVIYNNFATPRLMAILNPNHKYTIY